MKLSLTIILRLISMLLQQILAMMEGVPVQLTADTTDGDHVVLKPHTVRAVQTSAKK